MKRYVFDASALLIYFEDRSGAEKVEKVVLAGDQRDAEIFISAVNVGEVFYSLWQRRGELNARHGLNFVVSSPVKVVPATLAETIEAAQLKARYKVDFADSFAAALAISRKAVLVTSDPDFRRLSDRLKCLWL